jgi:hypothetical protein
MLRIRSSSPLDNYCVVQLVDGAGVDLLAYKYPPFAAKISRQSDGALRLQASGKTILSSTLFATMGEGAGNESGYLQPITLARPLSLEQPLASPGVFYDNKRTIREEAAAALERSSAQGGGGGAQGGGGGGLLPTNMTRGEQMKNAREVAMMIGQSIGLRGTTLSRFVLDKIQLARTRLDMGYPYSQPELYGSDIDLYKNID